MGFESGLIALRASILLIELPAKREIQVRNSFFYSSLCSYRLKIVIYRFADVTHGVI